MKAAAEAMRVVAIASFMLNIVVSVGIMYFKFVNTP